MHYSLLWAVVPFYSVCNNIRNIVRIRLIEFCKMSYQIAGRQKGSQVGDYLMPTNGIRGAQKRAGIQPKNHMKDNLIALKFAQARAREEREMSARKPKELYKLEQFRHVEPRVYEEAPSSPRRSARGDPNNSENYDDQAGEFLQKGAQQRRLDNLKAKNQSAREVIQAQIKDARFLANRPTTPRKGETPKHNDYGKLKEASNENWISKNRLAAEMMEAPLTMTAREKSKQESTVHESFGKVPQYLKNRKDQWASEKEEAARRAPDPNCPKGMKLMPEEERVQTLEVLRASREEAMNQLSRMPFILETPSAKRKHTELEMKLKEIEAALALFSKNKVYITDSK